jgi:uncharacterized protein (DUF1778 family)
METKADKLERISLRANTHQKLTLRRAAESMNMSVSEFILQSSMEVAQRELDRITRWKASQEQMDALAAALESPPRNIPELETLFSRPSVLEQ